MAIISPKIVRFSIWNAELIFIQGKWIMVETIDIEAEVLKIVTSFGLQKAKWIMDLIYCWTKVSQSVQVFTAPLFKDISWCEYLPCMAGKWLYRMQSSGISRFFLFFSSSSLYWHLDVHVWLPVSVFDAIRSCMFTEGVRLHSHRRFSSALSRPLISVPRDSKPCELTTLKIN